MSYVLNSETQAALRVDVATATFEHSLWLEMLDLDDSISILEEAIAEAQFEEDPDLSNSVARARAAVEDSGFVFDDDRYNGSADPFGDED